MNVMLCASPLSLLMSVGGIALSLSREYVCVYVCVCKRLCEKKQCWCVFLLREHSRDALITYVTDYSAHLCALICSQRLPSTHTISAIWRLSSAKLPASRLQQEDIHIIQKKKREKSERKQEKKPKKTKARRATRGHRKRQQAY